MLVYLDIVMLLLAPFSLSTALESVSAGRITVSQFFTFLAIGFLCPVLRKVRIRDWQRVSKISYIGGLLMIALVTYINYRKDDAPVGVMSTITLGFGIGLVFAIALWHSKKLPELEIFIND